MSNQLKSRRAASRTGTIRGAVLFGGLPVPHDIVCVEPDPRAWAGSDALGGRKPHPGDSSREWACADGHFEASGLAPGNYRVSARFQFGSVGFLPTRPFPHRVSVGEDGGMSVFDSEGRRLEAMKELPLELAVETPPKGVVMGRFRGVIRFLEDPPENIDQTPLFLAAREMRGQSRWLCAVRGRVEGGAVAFELAVPAGFQYILQLQSVHWAPVQAVPQTDQIRVGRSPVEMDIAVVKAGAVRVRTSRPDGAAYAPVFEGSKEGCAAGHSMDMRLAPDAMCFGRMVNPDGTFDLVGVPPGRYVGEIFPRGEGFSWFVPGLEGICVEAGRTAVVDLKLREGAGVRMGAAGPAAKPLEDSGGEKLGLYDGRERWARVLEAGTPLDRGAALRLWTRELHGRFQFKQDARGGWHAPQAVSAGQTVAAPGRYDAYLLETSLGWGPEHYVRILASRPGFEVGGQGAAVLSFQGAESCWGASGLAGKVSGAPDLTPEVAAGMGGDILKFLSWRPTVALKTESGRPAAFAWAQPSGLRKEEGFGVLLAALATGRFEPLAELLSRSDWTYEIPSLPAGNYGLELWAPDSPVLKRQVRLNGKRSVTLDLRLR